MTPKLVARSSLILSIAIASTVLAFLPAKATAQSLGPYLAATNALKELRHSAHQYQDAVSDRAVWPKDPAKRKELVAKAQALGERALKDADRLRKAIEKLDKKGGWEASTRYLKQLLTRYEKLIKEASRDMPAKSPVPRSEPPNNNPPRVEVRPRRPRPPRQVPNPLNTTLASNPVAVDRQVRQLILEIRLYGNWANDRFGRGHGVGLEAAMIESFRKHGATNTNVAVGWSFPIWVQTGSQMGNYPWRFLGGALQQFSLHLRSAKTVGEAEQSYLRYLKGVMKIWRRDRRKVAQWMNQLIDLEGQAGAALEPQTQPRFWTLYAQIQTLGKRINENKAIEVKPFNAWKDSQRSLEATLADEKKRQPGSRTDTRGTDSVTLTDDQVRGMLSEVIKRLKTQGMPSKWIDELEKDLPSVKFDASQTRDEGKVASYDGTSNTICLDPKIGLKGLREKGLKDFTQEAFHAWYDMVPYWSDLWLTQNEEDAAAGYIEELMMVGVQWQAVNEAIAQAGGNVTAALRGIEKIDDHFGKKMLARGFRHDGDRSGWNQLKAKYPKIVELESQFSKN